MQQEKTKGEVAGTLGHARQAAACLAVGLLLAVLLYTSLLRRSAAPAPQSLGLRVSERDGQLHVQWDRSSPVVLASRRAFLAITDGPVPTRIELDRNMLATGSVFYSRVADSASVKMTVVAPGGEPSEETVQVSGPAPLQLAAPDSQPMEAMLPPVIDDPPPVTDDPPPVIKETHINVTTAIPSAPEADRASDAGNTQPRPFRLPIVPRKTVAQVRTAIEPPQLLVPPGTQMRAAPVLPRTQVIPAPVPRKPEPVKEARVVQSGQIIWTGRLERRGIVEILGGKSSIGHLSGSLPGAPAAVDVFPGELLRTGLRLYTANPAQAYRSESAGPQNGWNATEYVWDPIKARDISVLEPPASQNGWQRLVLRAESRNYAVIVVRWSVRR